ncbi:cytochrome P450 [Thalassobius sp. S69A]|uniref:cytochrome P450 n=1 Tax=unclassified Thalassovita TaxID=2619711 RepID=UPI000C37DAD1|nr:cytochrome P450 [Thalassovita sp.]
MSDTVPLPARVPLVTQPLGLLASLAAARRNILSIIPDIATKQPMVSGKTGARWHMVMDPQALRRILLERLDDYPKSNVTKNLLRPAIGDSLFVAEGAHWRWQRRAAAPVFSHRNITNLSSIMTAAALRASDRIAQAGNRAVDMYDTMVRATFEVISDVTFSGDEGFDRSAVHTAIDSYIAEAGRVSLLDMFSAPDWIPRPNRLFAGRAVKQMKKMADHAIESRKNAPPSGIPDLLDLLLAGEDPETKRRMNTAELRDNLLAFIVAGHETTALTLAWALYLCAHDPAIQSRARQEAQSVLSPGAPATAQDVPDLPFIRMIIDEALRLYPPAALVSRTAQKPDILGGRTIQPGDTVILPFYALHRNHLLWDAPDAFHPDRFADRKSIARFTYLPFGDGPRICIGASFALQEAVIILATLLAQYRFTAIPGRAPKPVMILTLRPEGGVWLQAERLP